MTFLILSFNIILLSIHLIHIFLFHHFDIDLIDEWTALLLHSIRTLVFFTPTYITWYFITKKLPKDLLKKYTFIIIGLLYIIIEFDYYIIFIFRHESILAFIVLSLVSTIISYLVYKIINSRIT